MYFLVLFSMTHLDTFQKMELEKLQTEVKVLKEELKSTVKKKDGIMTYFAYMFVCYYFYVEKIQMLEEQSEQDKKLKKCMYMELDKTRGTD